LHRAIAEMRDKKKSHNTGSQTNQKSDHKDESIYEVMGV
jgi:hypothetical protein